MSKLITNNHIEIIVGTFVIGTLAFVVANAWNDFSREILKKLEEENDSYKPGEGMIFYSGMYVIAITCFSLVMVYILIWLEVIHHAGHITG